MRVRFSNKDQAFEDASGRYVRTDFRLYYYHHIAGEFRRAQVCSGQEGG